MVLEDTIMERSVGFLPSGATLRRYLILAYGAAGTIFDCGVMVLGSLLVGLGTVLTLVTFGVVETSMDNTTAALLASALVSGVVGLFLLGIAAEGPVGRGRRLVGFELWEVAAARAVMALAMGGLFLVAHALITGPAEALPAPIDPAVAAVRAVGLAGIVGTTFVGVPLAWEARRRLGETMGEIEIPVIYTVWVIATMVFL